LARYPSSSQFFVSMSLPQLYHAHFTTSTCHTILDMSGVWMMLALFVMNENDLFRGFSRLSGPLFSTHPLPPGWIY
jgi:hypothetical protein